jgi:endonuclease YncB( thermonuclease family)
MSLPSQQESGAETGGTSAEDDHRSAVHAVTLVPWVASGPAERRPEAKGRPVRTGWLVGIATCLSLLGCQQDVTASHITSTDTQQGPLLHAARGGDGDSWKDTHGVEYRLGLVNTPELSECYGSIASSKRKQLTAAGFRATSYAVDTHKRHVAVVFLADGRNLNVWLARNGYANDRYLKQFRSENPALAAQLDDAFAAAKRERLGLWSACGAAQPQR